MSDKPARENQRQHAAFLIYSQLPELSVQKLWETWGKHMGLKNHKRPSFPTLELWCTKYQWVARAEAIHQAAKEEAIKKAVLNVTMKKEEILAITRAVMIRYGQQLREDSQGKITMADFEKAWKIQRIEMGLPIEIGRQELDMQDGYDELSDEQLLAELERFTQQYKEKRNRSEAEVGGNKEVTG